MDNSLEILFAADPQLAEAVSTSLRQKQAAVDEQTVQLVVAESIRSLAQEVSFGRAVGRGMAELAGRVDTRRLLQYRDIIRRAARQGPTLARIMAIHLVAVFLHASTELLENFLAVTRIMRSKGTYTLNRPLACLAALLRQGDQKSASAYLALLATAFSRDLNYDQCLQMTALLAEAAAALDANKRAWQFKALERVIDTDHQLARDLFEGLQKGLQRLDQPALEQFVNLGLEKYCQQPEMGRKFFSLASTSGRETCRRMQYCVGLDEVQPRLNRYLSARTGMQLAVRSLSDLPQNLSPWHPPGPWVCSDGQFVYLPDEIDIFRDRSQNLFVYRALTRLEAAFYEFATFGLDLEKTLEQFEQAPPAGVPEALRTGFDNCLETLRTAASETPAGGNSCDLQRFLNLFPLPDLAADLFTIIELARLRRRLMQCYAGLVRRVMPLLCREALCRQQRQKEEHPLQAAYMRLALGLDEAQGSMKSRAFAEKITGLWRACCHQYPGVEMGARIVGQVYCEAAALAGCQNDGMTGDHFYRPLPVAFGWRPRPELFHSPDPQIERLAVRLRAALSRAGLHVYRSDLAERLRRQKGHLSQEAIEQLAGAGLPAGVSLEQLLNGTACRRQPDFYVDAGDHPVFWYREWDCHLSDYLQQHVRVVERPLSAAANDFFQQVLIRRRGLIQRMRRAFELLKPRGLMILRQWPEGDQFDYRALMDYALDRRAGITPSERLYIKRVKQRREVAVLLLVDLSRSTANRVPGSSATVLEVEKEAIVILTQALELLGDTFGIAGFSGSGRLGVDYFRVKDFDEKLDETVKRRIGAVSAQRNTRMGAAVRHAAVRLEQVPARVRLLIVLGDGFPNDLGYKRRYAVADTRRAIYELQARNIYTHAITVNQAADPQLDDLYGHIHHSLISDVRQLPDKLVWIYGRLTRP